MRDCVCLCVYILRGKKTKIEQIKKKKAERHNRRISDDNIFLVVLLYLKNSEYSCLVRKETLEEETI